MKIEVHKLPVTDSTTVVEGRIQILEQELDIAALEDLAARPLSAIFSSDQQLKGLFWGARLDSPDEIKVKLLQVKKEQIVVELDYLNYKGPLLKNVLSQALVVFELGSFHPGRYTLQVIVSNYEFSKYNQPSPEQFLNKDTYSFDFRIE